jgi:hypothetical protein
MLRFPVCQLRMSVLSSAHIAAYRDERAQSVKPATVNRDLGIISIGSLPVLAVLVGDALPCIQQTPFPI